MNILVSACLLGVACRYDGKSKPDNNVIKLMEKYNLIPFCPEITGGLPTPRPASEIVDNKVLSEDGIDVTEQYNKGALEALKLAKMYNCKYAILKEKSPSCGKGVIHNGKFDGGYTNGDGVTAKLFLQNGIIVLGETEIKKYENQIFLEE